MAVSVYAIRTLIRTIVTIVVGGDHFNLFLQAWQLEDLPQAVDAEDSLRHEATTWGGGLPDRILNSRLLCYPTYFQGNEGEGPDHLQVNPKPPKPNAEAKDLRHEILSRILGFGLKAWDEVVGRPQSFRAAWLGGSFWATQDRV